jgi:hypothetical protein
MRCAYLEMDNMGDFVTDADLSIGPMASLGWQVDMVSWRTSDVDWNDFDAVYICTPWDYPEAPDEFMRVLERINTSSAILVNDIALVRWSLAKTYLRDLEVQGADIVPSTWFDCFDAAGINSCFARNATDRIVIKPQVGANAGHAYVLKQPIEEHTMEELRHVFNNRPYLVQPFISTVQTEGEFSLFFFASEYSHAILKLPKDGDFRTQEEHGSDIKSIVAEAGLIDTARKVLALVEPQPVYVRADFVRGDDDGFLLMELELIEPSMYLRTDEESAGRFARAFDAHVRQRVASPAA